MEKVTLDVKALDEGNAVKEILLSQDPVKDILPSQEELPWLGIKKADINGVEKVTLDVNASDETNPVKEISLSQESCLGWESRKLILMEWRKLLWMRMLRMKEIM